MTKTCDVTFTSQNVTFQVRCDAARFRKSFKYFQKCDDFPGTWYKCDDIVTSSHHFSGFGLEQTFVSFKTWPGPGFWVPGFLISAWNESFQAVLTEGRSKVLGTTLSKKSQSQNRSRTI